MVVINKVGNIFQGTLPQLAAVLAGTLVGINGGMQFGWTAPIIPVLLGPNSPVQTTKYEAEWLETALMAGSFCTLGLTTYLVDKIGRKKSLLVSSAIAFIAWTIIALSPRMEYIFFARAFAGSADNMCFVAAPMYIAEIADQKIRGFLSSIIFLMMNIGTILIYSVGPFVPVYAHCIIGASIVLLELIIFPFMPESPYYWFYKDKPDKAKKSLLRLRPSNANFEEELADIKQAVEKQKQEKGRLKDLILVPSNRKAIIIMTILNTAQHFSSISATTMNLHSILAAAGSIYMQPSSAAILFSCIMFVAAITASILVDKYGRKTLLISSSILCGICLMVLSIYFTMKHAGYDMNQISWIPIVSVMLYALFFKLGLGMVPIVLTAELFPTKIKAIGMTLADGLYVLASIISLQIYQVLTNNYGIEYPFYVFSISCFIAAAFTFFFVPETKGKSLDEIQTILKGGKVLTIADEDQKNDTKL